MSIWTRAACAVGRHSGEWSLPGDRCETVRICDSCGKLEKKWQHIWSPFGYVAANQCDQTRRCDRCGSAQTRSAHEWGPWVYVNNEVNSPQAHTCRRCHRNERTAYTMR